MLNTTLETGWSKVENWLAGRNIHVLLSKINTVSFGFTAMVPCHVIENYSIENPTTDKSTNNNEKKKMKLTSFESLGSKIVCGHNPAHTPLLPQHSPCCQVPAEVSFPDKFQDRFPLPQTLRSGLGGNQQCKISVLLRCR